MSAGLFVYLDLEWVGCLLPCEEGEEATSRILPCPDLSFSGGLGRGFCVFHGVMCVASSLAWSVSILECPLLLAEQQFGGEDPAEQPASGIVSIKFHNATHVKPH